MRESIIEKYLHKQVTAAGGTTRKFTGWKNVPDRIVIWPTIHTFEKPRIVKDAARIHFVETKATGKTARAGQVREHKRLRALGCVVLVLDTKAKVDNYVANNR